MVVVIDETITFERLVVACSARSVSSKGFSELLRRPEKNTYTNDQKNDSLKEKRYLSDGYDELVEKIIRVLRFGSSWFSEVLNRYQFCS